ncbi:substrate-binding periplasmic protein [Rugamonas sp. CCM 8940]|uniref:substrate-binding periplasmic protein n=1 Tax=Rugamonas sp. CCM 8940 TaxID=2765359 RepID=UPI0018F58F45|nr:transporter substrate-binding domain-containing protein [Rugamonas sp. CCM 8940]MBJ7313968.1 transporter substrate-binding domain-containing protein [Rugamonas sp. CCM 8940]
MPMSVSLPPPRHGRLRRAAALALLLWAGGAGAVDIRTAAQDATAPKFVAQHGVGGHQVGGLCIDILHAIERLDPELRFVGTQHWLPVPRVEAGVAAGTLDVACALLRTPEREARFHFIEPALFPANFYLAVRADDQVRVKDWDDVRRLGEQGTVLVMHGFGIAQRLKRIGGLRVDDGGNDSVTNFNKLLAGRGRFYLHRAPGIQWEISRAGMDNRIKLLSPPILSEGLYMVASRKLPAERVERMRLAIVQLRGDGTLERLRVKWEGEAP